MQDLHLSIFLSELNEFADSLRVTGLNQVRRLDKSANCKLDRLSTLEKVNPVNSATVIKI